MRGKNPAIGETRIVTRFALFPIECNNGDWAWLETVTIEQKYTDRFGGPHWEDIRFMDKKE